MAAIELVQKDIISSLPKEIAFIILGYLQPKDLLQVSQVCPSWELLADDYLLWKKRCHQVGITAVKPCSVPSCTSSWKEAYLNMCRLKIHWAHMLVKMNIVARSRKSRVFTTMYVDGDRILCARKNGTLELWCAISGTHLRTLKGHKQGVPAIQMIGDLIVSGSMDCNLRVWDAQSGICQQVLVAHCAAVLCLRVYKDRVVSGSFDHTVRVWSLSDGECIRILTGHVDAVCCVEFDAKAIISVSFDASLKIWSPDTLECLYTYMGHCGRICNLQYDGKHVVSSSDDTKIHVWDVETGQQQRIITLDEDLAVDAELHLNKLVTGHVDRTVKVWDILNGNRLLTLSGPNQHHSAINYVKFTDYFIITSSTDGVVKLWDARTGAFIRNILRLRSRSIHSIYASATLLICLIESRSDTGTYETELLVLNFNEIIIPHKCN